MATSTLVGGPMPAPITFFERYLTVWVFLCIVVGILLGQLFPGVFQGRPGQPLERLVRKSGARCAPAMKSPSAPPLVKLCGFSFQRR